MLWKKSLGMHVHDKGIVRKREPVRLGTHGENYGNWMSAPVFYMVGALVVLMAVLCVILHFIPGMEPIGVLALIAAAAVLILLGWLNWIRGRYAFGGGGMMEKVHEVLLSPSVPIVVPP